MIGRIIANHLAGYRVLRKLKDSFSKNLDKYGDPFYNARVVEQHAQPLAGLGIETIKDWSILEIGPGGNMGNGIILCAAGARNVYLVDNYRHVDFQRKLFDYYKALTDGLKNGSIPLQKMFPGVNQGETSKNIDNCIKFENETFTINAEKIIFLAPYNAKSVPLDGGQINWVFSQAVMEHVDDPEAVCRENARLLKPGGIVSHQIDLRDHFQIDSLEMLKYSDRTWRLMSSNSHGCVNRARAPHFEMFFKNAGLDIVQSIANEKLRDPTKLPTKVDSRFAGLSREQLSILGQFIVGLKRA